MASEPVQNDSIWSKLQMSKNLASPYHLRWDRCQAYLRGDQLLSFQTGRDDLTPTDASRRKKRVIVNQILNLYRHIASRLITNYPSMACLPASESTDDILKAQASEEALRYFWQSNNMKEMLRHCIQWLVGTGTVGIRTYYRPDKNVVISEYIRPYDLRFEPYVNDPAQSAWIGVCKYVRKEDLLAQFPDYAEQISEHATPAIRYYSYGPRSIPEDRYEYYDVYHRTGLHEVWAGGIKVFETQTPGDRCPVQVIRYTEIEGYAWGLGLIEPMLEQQDLYNEMRTQIRMNAKLLGNPKILINRNAGVEDKAFSDAPGEKIKWDGEVAPTPYIAPPLPQYLVEQPAAILSEMFDIAGIHGTSLGKRTIGVDSGVAVNATANNDSQQLQLTQDAIENAVKEMALDVLTHMQAFYTEKKAVRMLDTAGKLIWSELDATRLQDDPEIFLEAGTLFKSEAEDRDNRTLMYLKAGLIKPEDAKRNMSYRLEPLHVLDQIQGLKHAKDVLDAVKGLGARVVVYPTDDLDSMERVVRQFMQTPEYYELDQAGQGPGTTPRQDAVENLYGQIVQLKMQRDNPAMMLPPGTLPGGPTPPPPVIGGPSPAGPAPRGPAPNGMGGAVAPGMANIQRMADRAETSAQRTHSPDEVK